MRYRPCPPLVDRKHFHFVFQLLPCLQLHSKYFRIEPSLARNQEGGRARGARGRQPCKGTKPSPAELPRPVGPSQSPPSSYRNTNLHWPPNLHPIDKPASLHCDSTQNKESRRESDPETPAVLFQKACVEGTEILRHDNLELILRHVPPANDTSITHPAQVPSGSSQICCRVPRWCPQALSLHSTRSPRQTPRSHSRPEARFYSDRVARRGRQVPSRPGRGPQL